MPQFTNDRGKPSYGSKAYAYIQKKQQVPTTGLLSPTNNQGSILSSDNLNAALLMN